MPYYKTNERDENNQTVYKDACNPIAAEFRRVRYFMDSHSRFIWHLPLVYKYSSVRIAEKAAYWD